MFININKEMRVITYFIIASLSMMSIISLYSCKKDSNAGAAPVITRVRMPDAAKADSLVTKARPGMSIVIEGINLSNAKQVLFNGYSAYFNAAFNTDSHIWVDIPQTTPTPDRFPDVPNTITVITPNGEAVYNFPVEPPPPSIDSVVNENPAPGSVLIIKGRYFYSVKEVKFPDSSTTKEITVNETGTQLRITVPKGIRNVEGRVVLQSQYGNDTTDILFNKKEGIGIISNFDNISYYIQGGTDITDNESLFPENTGKYYRSSLLPLGSWDKQWWNAGRGAVFGTYNKTWFKVLDNSAIAAINNVDTLNNFALKFEINTKTTWDKNLLFRISFNQKYGYSFQPWLYYSSGVFNTENKWITFTIPLKEFKTVLKGNDHYPPDPKGTPVSKLSDLFNENGEFNNMLIRTQTENSGTAAMHFAIDNIRVVRMKN